MSRHLISLWTEADRRRAREYVTKAPQGTRVEFKAVKRSTDQNSMLWACLSDVSYQHEHRGKKYTPDTWKIIFLHAIGREVQFVPALNSDEMVPWGQSSSDLSKSEMSDLINFILAWGSENGVVFHDQQQQAAE